MAVVILQWARRHLRADFVFAWPAAEIAVMGPEGAANIIFRKEITTSKRSGTEQENKKLKNTRQNLQILM